MNYFIETRELSKQYKNQLVLDKVSIHVDEGKVYGLLGPNGAGKSTLLKLITGAIQSNSGEIIYRGKRMRETDMKEIGAIIESPAIYPNLTAYENLEVLTTLLNLDKSRIEKVLEIVSLEHTGKKLAKEFSLGMKQRLGIGMALINDPKLLILDEPTNGLDPVGIRELRELIKSFARQGITVILSSHILSEVQQVADKIGIINQGHLSYEDINHTNETDLEELFMKILKKEEIENAK